MLVIGVFIACPGSIVAFLVGASIAGKIAAAASMPAEATQAFMVLAGCFSCLAVIWAAAEIISRQR